MKQNTNKIMTNANRWIWNKWKTVEHFVCWSFFCRLKLHNHLPLRCKKADGGITMQQSPTLQAFWTNFQDKASFEKGMQILSSAAKFHLNRPQDFWNNVIWTDDTKVQSTDIWPSCTAPRLRKTRYLIPAVKQGGGGVIIWTLFSAMGFGTLLSLSQP